MSKILVGVVLFSIAVISSGYESSRSSVQRNVAAANPAPANGRWSPPRVDPANFVSRVDNPYLPLTPGTTLRYRGVQKNGTTRRSTLLPSRTRRSS